MVIKPDGSRREDIALGTKEYMAKVLEIRDHQVYGPVSCCIERGQRAGRLTGLMQILRLRWFYSWEELADSEMPVSEELKAFSAQLGLWEFLGGPVRLG